MAEIPSTPFKFIWFSIRPYRKWFWIAVVFILFSQLFSDLQSYAYKGLIDAADHYSRFGGSLTHVYIWIAAIPLLLLFTVITIRTVGFMLNSLTAYARTYSTKALFNYLSLHSLSYFNDRFSGALGGRVNRISSNISRLINQFINNILSIFFSLCTTLVLLSLASHKLAYAFVIGFIVLIPINIFFTRKQVALSTVLAEIEVRLQGQIIDSISNISAVQQYARRDYEISRLAQIIKEDREADVRSDNFRERILLLNNILVWIFIAVIIGYGFLLWRRLQISTGELFMVTTLTLGFMRALTWIGQSLNNLTEFYGEVREGLREIIQPHDIIDVKDAKNLVAEEGRVSFENITFAYNEKNEDVFIGLNLEVNPGEKIGIVGTSGAGKTTLMKLLLRQYDVTSGCIKIDGQDIKSVTQESLRENISVVPQEPVLFHRTIRENIMYGKLDASEKEMIEVAEKAQAHDFIEKLPQKYDSLVGERGVKLSVGQRQRIAIARAFLKSAPILVLDEATSALDSESEVAVQTALHNLMEGKTVFAIAHRLSTLRDMDRILVFKDGKIIEDGSHTKLLKNKDGAYASLWTHQAGGFIKTA